MLGSQHLTNTEAASHIDDILSKNVTVDFEANLIAGDKFLRFDSETKGYGDSLKIPTITNLAAFDKNPNSQVILDNPTETHVTILLDSYKTSSFLIEDLTTLQTKANLRALYEKRAEYAIRSTHDADILAKATSFSTSKGAYNTTITEAVMLSAYEAMNVSDVPLEERCWLFRPEVVSDLLDIDDFTRYDATGYAGHIANAQVGSTAGLGSKKNGLCGQVLNSPVYMTTQVLKSGTNISNLYAHKDALGIAVQEMVNVNSSYENIYQGWLTVAKLVYGVAVVRDEAGIEIKA